jgi:hypothetical protein
LKRGAESWAISEFQMCGGGVQWQRDPLGTWPRFDVEPKELSTFGSNHRYYAICHRGISLFSGQTLVFTVEVPLSEDNRVLWTFVGYIQYTITKSGHRFKINSVADYYS